VAFDGRYVYLIPSVNTHRQFLRWDSTQALTGATAWESFDALPGASTIFYGTHRNGLAV